MALQTKGFALSALPEKLKIPGNVGMVDVKEIYDGVKLGLDAYEAVRRAPQSMALADAQMKAGIEQAPLATRGLLAQTEAAEAQGPLRTSILAAEASPEMQAAKLRAMETRAAPKPLTGVPYLLDRVAGLEQAVANYPEDALLSIALNDARKELTKGRDIAAANIAGRESVAAGTNISKEGIAANRNATTAAEGEANRLSREMMQTADLESKQRLQTEELASREKIAASQSAMKQSLATAKTDAQRAALGSQADLSLKSGEYRAKLLSDKVDKAITNLTGTPDGVGTSSSIPGGDIFKATVRVIGSNIPGSNSADLAALIQSIEGYMGFDELKQMRLSAPGGRGASGLGQVTEKELAFLQSVVANLKLKQSDEQLVENLKLAKEATQTAWRNIRAAYERDFGAPMPAGGAPQPSATGPTATSPAQPVTSQWTEADERRLQELKAKQGR